MMLNVIEIAREAGLDMGDIRATTPYIRESWYPAGWSGMLDDGPVKRKFLEEDIVLYKTAGGDPVALGNICPHRFAQLHKGRIHGESIACAYHGLRFGPDGQCSYNPNGPVPKSVRVRAYPLTERYGMIWIWMGDPANADPATLPLIADKEDDRFEWVTGYLHVEGNYQLVIDNLLDLTHVEFLHPFLANADTPVADEDRMALDFECFEDGDQVVSRYYRAETPRTGLVGALWHDVPETMSMFVEMRWNAPANLVQENHFDVANAPGVRQSGFAQIPFCHLLTPETATTTHYFWGTGRNLQLGNEAIAQALTMGVSETFAHEDEPMIADIQDYMGSRDLMDMKPLLLPIDKSAVLARRRVTARLAEEARAGNSADVRAG